MKKNVRKLLAIGFMAVFIISTVAAVGVGFFRPNTPASNQVPLTNTPEDNYSPDKWTTFCQSENGTKSTKYITEYKIPTLCTQPLSITTDPSGNVWFTETNTGRIAKFDPSMQTFQEFDNPLWQKGEKSMTWGIYYEPNGNIWFSDSQHNLIWKFDTKTKNYSSFVFPKTPGQSDAFPQMLKPDGADLVVNDFEGKKISIFSTNQTGTNLKTVNVNSPGNYNFTSDLTVDPAGNIWYTVWNYQLGGALIKYNPQNSQLANYTLPPGILAPNGISVGPRGDLWITDTASSMFISFDPKSEQFTKYITSTPQVSTYGNASGLIRTPITRPYWNQFDDKGRLWFNEQVANSLAVFDPLKGTLVEYLVPSKNPNWSDCGTETDCGVAQVLDFTVGNGKVWFPEWVENNIGVLDPSVPLPFSQSVTTTSVTLHRGQNETVDMTLNPNGQVSGPVDIMTQQTASTQDLKVSTSDSAVVLDKQKTISINLRADDFALSGAYKVLVSARYQDLTVSQIITVTIQ
ncbi:MAG TPA: SMP-30/gluconolactonase/LRE family protein [Candidatus Nitrosotalea sp.]|nr:SMP-30/gluconolactonase/LRE family protein [Candidatus Nitrosotalea sp.]